MSQRAGDLLAIFQSIQKIIRVKAGKALPAVLKRWRYTKSSDFSSLPLLPGVLRFLARYGLLDSGAESDVLLQSYHQLLERISRSSGEAPGVVAAWIELFACGEYAVLTQGICSDAPQCGICPLKDDCRYLIAGGKESGSFGQSVASELLLASASNPADLRSSELLAFMLVGEKSGSADVARAEALLKSCDGLRGLFQATPETLRDLGISGAARARLQALSELCRNWVQERPAQGHTFSCGKDFYDHYHLRLREMKREAFIVVSLNQKNCVISDEHVSIGSLTETLVHPREVFVRAIQDRAAAIVILHNHPSGDPEPSSADKAITKRLASVAKIVGIRLLDHVIIGDGRFTSFVEQGLMEP